jgi:hypothetical protein
MNLRVEGRRDLHDATEKDVRQALAAFGTERGATWVLLTTPDGSYAQAAGTRGRFVIEVRDVFGGEGWRHWRACRAGAGDGPAVVTFRRRCPNGKHPPRGCPIRVLQSDILGRAQVAAALSQFVQDGSRCTQLAWRDVSSEFLPDSDDEGEFGTIGPLGPDGN